MGSIDNIIEIFEFKDKWENKLHLVLEDSPSKQRTLEIEGDCFEVTKPLAKKIIKELSEEFKINLEGLNTKTKGR